ncbi:alpha/beta fold hydrolase [Actinomyces oricola]
MSYRRAITTRLRVPGGRWLHVVEHRPQVCFGPTLVLESGLGLSRLLWARTVPRLTAQGMTVVTYDRAGLGLSPPTGRGRPLRELTGDLLHVVASRAGSGAILVAHSYGAILARHAAALRPELVTGLVLIEPSTERILAEASLPGRMIDAAVQGLLVAAYRLGGGGAVLDASGFRHLPRNLRRRVRAEDSDAATVRSRGHELFHYPQALMSLAANPLPAPAVPVTVLRARGPSAWAWAAYEYASAVPNGRVMVARTRSHMVPLTDPGSVVRAVVSTATRRRMAPEDLPARDGR